jgi:hypothetical protein
MEMSVFIVASHALLVSREGNFTKDLNAKESFNSMQSLKQLTNKL